MPSFYKGTRTQAQGARRALRIAALYLSPKHWGGPPASVFCPDLATLVRTTRRHQAKSSLFPNNDVELYHLACEEQTRLADRQRGQPNVTLTANGRLHVHYTSYQRARKRIDPDFAKALIALNGANPLALAVMRPSRLALRSLLRNRLWTISPEAHAAIEAALHDFDEHHAPLLKPSPIQALGWLDETDEIRCRKAIGYCLPGEVYPVKTEIYAYQHLRESPDPWLPGGSEKILTSGHDLLVTIAGLEFLQRPHNPEQRTLADLITHFETPEVEDVTTLQPERYQLIRQKLALYL
jgi:hypothetical protein